MSKLPALVLVLLFSSIASAQTTLQLGTPVERELGSSQTHEFTVNLEESDFVQLVVEQRGIDAIVKVFSPSGKSLGEYDSPNGTDGPEHVSFIAATAGSYRVTVGPLNPKDETTGRYQIKILELRQATDQELKTSRNLEVTKARGLALLTEIEETIPQIKSPQIRIRALLQTAQLLWDIDEKRASKCLADAVTTLREFLASMDQDDVYQHSPVSLRHEVITALAARDPDAALSFLHSTGQMISSSMEQREHLRQESIIELSIADQVIQNNPNRALQIARQNLKRGYSSNLVNTLSQLRVKNPELGAELANEIVAKLVNENLLKSPDGAGLAVNLLNVARPVDSRFQSPNRVSPQPLLTEDKYRELLRKVFDEASSYSVSQPSDPGRNPAWEMLNMLQSMAAELDTAVPGGSAAVQKKMAEINRSRNYVRFSQNVTVSLNNPAELSAEALEKMPVEVREQHYIQVAHKEANDGNLARAKQIINDHVGNPYQRREAIRMLEQQEVLRSINKGKVEEALRALNGIQNSRERAQQLAQIANHIGPGQKRAVALNLLEQAREMLSPPPRAQNQEEMWALMEIARAFSRYDVKRAFDIIDPAIEQFNEICAAARTLEGFGVEYYDEDEVDLHNGNPVSAIGSHISTTLGSLAVISFDRAKVTTDRIKAPEIRLRVYLDIAQQTIQAAK